MPPRRAQLFSMRATAPFSNSRTQSGSASGFVCVDVGAHLAVDGFDRRAAEEPVGEGDAVAAEVHQRAAAAAVDVPEPVAVRGEMFFALLDEINFAEGTGVGHFFCF